MKNKKAPLCREAFVPGAEAASLNLKFKKKHEKNAKIAEFKGLKSFLLQI